MSRPPTERTRIHRHPERATYDRKTVDAILDEALLCHLALALDGHPSVIPTIHVRIGDELYVHGSAASRTLRAVKTNIEVCVEVTLLDGLVLARSTPKHSMNYRSVVLYGRARPITDPTEKYDAQMALVEHIVPGRAADVRAPNASEMKETLILAIRLDEASAKVRTGPPSDPEEDLTSAAWAGVLPFHLMPGEPEPDPRLDPRTPVPDYVRQYRRSPTL
jgi:nitroimidazol reductase NimA-like FMN-containing flavoprotein (pyridoxamine 5'-phosphate oxidase superfamily)